MLVTMKRATAIPHAVREERAGAEDELPHNGDMCDGFMCVSGFEVGTILSVILREEVGN